MFDLIDDPNEKWDLMDKRLDCICGALEQSAAKYPHIKPGQEFTGYS